LLVVVAPQTHPLALMAVPVARLSEGLAAQRALERHVFLVNSHVIPKVAKLWELHWAQLALKDLIESLRLRVHAMDQVILSLVLDLLV